MKVHRRVRRVLSMEFRFESPVPASREALEAWHHGAGALGRLIPPTGGVEVCEAPASIANGERAQLRVRLLPGIHANWLAEHTEVEPGVGFTDVQLEGPFRLWYHRHEFRADPSVPGASLLVDRVTCEPFGGFAGRLLAGPMLRRRIGRLFAWRHQRTRGDLMHLARCKADPKHILITGATGMVGRSLVPLLKQAGHRITTLSRHASGPGSRVWDPARGYIDLAGLPPVDVVVHLAGENVAAGRWTATRRRAILESREQGTALLARSLAALDPKPAALVCASGTSIYPADGRPHDESGPTDASTFLGHVVDKWESAADPARKAGIRVVHLRTGVVLNPAGGALAAMLRPFLIGLGGPVGGGRPAMSWIADEDFTDLIHYCCLDETMEGVINAVAPQPASSTEFADTLGAVLGRPALLPVPSAPLRLFYGQMADETILANLHVVPGKLLAAGFPYRWPCLEGALRHLLMRDVPPVAPPKQDAPEDSGGAPNDGAAPEDNTAPQDGTAKASSPP